MGLPNLAHTIQNPNPHSRASFFAAYSAAQDETFLHKRTECNLINNAAMAKFAAATRIVAVETRNEAVTAWF